MSVAGGAAWVAESLRTAPAAAPLVFQAVHALFTARKLRLADHGLSTAQKTPLTSLVTFLAINFGAAIVLALLFGDALSFLGDPTQMGIAIGVWYLVFFSPLDVVFLVTDIQPVKAVIATVEGVRNGHRVLYGAGAGDASKWLTRFLRGWLAGAGSVYTAQLARFFQGTNGANEFVRPSVVNKVLFVSSALLVGLPLLDGQSWLSSLWPETLKPVEQAVIGNVDLIVILGNVLFLLIAVFDADFDPVAPWVQPLWKVAFGGGARVPRRPLGALGDRAVEVAAVAATVTAPPAATATQAVPTSPATVVHDGDSDAGAALSGARRARTSAVRKR